MILQSGLVWWASDYLYRDQYAAEEASRIRLMTFLDALRSEYLPKESAS